MCDPDGAPWDLEELAAFAGKHHNVRSFVNTTLSARAFRDGHPPDGSKDRRTWLETFWRDLDAKGLRGYRPAATARLPSHLEAVVKAIGATMVSGDGRAVFFVTTDNRVFLNCRATESSVVVEMIVVASKGRGLGRAVCGALAAWAAERGIPCSAVLVMAPEFFHRIGWLPVGGAEWRAPGS